jgi:hypothetical protein
MSERKIGKGERDRERVVRTGAFEKWLKRPKKSFHIGGGYVEKSFKKIYIFHNMYRFRFYLPSLNALHMYLRTYIYCI